MQDYGKEIKRVYDEYGPIQVFDDGNKRYLAFGRDEQQGCILKSSPSLIQYSYVRAMLLSLLFDDTVRNCLVLGLGTGALANALFQQIPETRIDVVELRKLVIDIAYREFQLPRDHRLSVVQGDAGEVISVRFSQSYDLILSDIYDSTGMDEQQAQKGFIDNCMNNLTDSGWLVLNFWHDHKKTDLMPYLESLFSQIWVNTIDTGNWIVMATQNKNTLSNKQIKERAKVLSDRFGFSFVSVASGLRRII